MKNVAATKGHRVSFAEFFLVAERIREGKFAGTDMLLNFYRCPPKRNSWPALREFLRVAIEEYKVCTCMQQKNASARIFFHRLVARPQRQHFAVLPKSLRGEECCGTAIPGCAPLT
jgi:hypothetical protein